MIPENDKELICELISGCNELINGKFILADNKISKILKCIAESKVLYELISECMQEFNKNRELNKAMVKMPSKPGYFVMPEDKAKIIPLVFCVLVEIENRQIDFRNFLKTYFAKQDTDEYCNFAHELIEPFKNAIADLFDMPNDYISPKEEIRGDKKMKEEQNLEDEEEFELENDSVSDEDETTVTNQESFDSSEVFKDILRVCEEMLASLSCEKKQNENTEDAEYILSAIVNACQDENFYQVNALIVGLNYCIGKIKCLKFLNKELKEIVKNYYLQQK